MNNELKRELNMEELDQVVGGEFSYNGGDFCVINGKTMSVSDFNQGWRDFAYRFGYKVTCKTLHNETGYWWDGMEDEDGNIDLVIYKFWEYIGRVHSNHYSY